MKFKIYPREKDEKNIKSVAVNLDELQVSIIEDCIFNMNKEYEEKGKNYDYLKNTQKDNDKRNEQLFRYKKTLDKLNIILNEIKQHIEKHENNDVISLKNYKEMQGTTPNKIYLDGDEPKDVNTWSQVLISTCEFCIRKDKKKFESIAPTIKGRTRQYFSTDSSTLYAGRPIEGTNFVVECNNSTDILLNTCYELLNKMNFNGELVVEIK